MRKKYQVFISSTFEDLKTARQLLFKTTYQMGHIPIGMEGFTATSMDQWKYITDRIKEADYFAVVVAHRYGSPEPTGSGMSFTQAEYRFASDLGVPIMRFVIDESAEWSKALMDSKPTVVKKLNSFKAELKSGKMVAYWKTPEELSLAYSTALSQLIEIVPRGGLSATRIPDDLGVMSATEFSNNIDHSDLMRTSGKLRLTLNDGYNFFKKYLQILDWRCTTGLPTDILLVHPASPSISTIAIKSDKVETQQIRDIQMALDVLRNLPNALGSLRCFGHRFVNTYSLTMTDNRALVTLYPSRMRFDQLPAFQIERTGRGGLYAFYRSDFERLLRDAESKEDGRLL
jgi:hypothetical protein